MLVVPTPTRPALSIRNLVAVEEPTTNEGALRFAAVGFTENAPHGVVEPTPVSPFARMVICTALSSFRKSIEPVWFAFTRSAPFVWSAENVSLPRTAPLVPKDTMPPLGRLTLPFTLSFWVGAAVPIPTLPEFVTTSCVPVEEPMTNDGALPFAAVGSSENCAHGVEVPIPTTAVPVEESESAEGEEVAYDEGEVVPT